MKKKRVFLILLFLSALIGTSYISAWFDWDRGAAAAAVGNWDKAACHYANAVSSDPDNPELLYDYGVASFHTGALDQAEVCFEVAAQSKAADLPLKEQAYFNLGNVKVQKEQFSKAVTAYEHALRINPENEKAKHNRDLAKQKEEEKKEQEEQQSQNDDSNEQEDSDQQSDDSDGSQGDQQDQSQSDDDSQEQQDQDNEDESSDQGNSSQDQEQQGDNDDSSPQQEESRDESQDNANNSQDQQDQKQSDKKQNKEQQKDSDKDHQQPNKGQEEEQSSDKMQEQNAGSTDEESAGGGASETEDEEDILNDNLEGVSPWIADMLAQQEAHESELSKEKMKSAINAGQAGSNEKNAW